MKTKEKIVTNYNEINAYTRNKLDSDIEKISKAILKLEDYIFHYQDTLEEKKEQLVDQKEILDKLTNLKRFNC